MSICDQMLTETSNTEIQRGTKKNESLRTEYLRSVGRLQKVINAHVIGVKEKRKKGIEETFEVIMAEIFPILMTDTRKLREYHIQTVESQRQRGKS